MDWKAGRKLVAAPKRRWFCAVLACPLFLAAESWAANQTTLDIVVIAEEDILLRRTPVGVEKIKAALKQRLLHHAERSQRYVLAERIFQDYEIMTVLGCMQVEETCLKQYRESRNLGRVVSADIRKGRVRMMVVEAAATRDGGWRDLPSDEPALSRAIESWTAELFDARSVLIVQLAKAGAGAGMSAGGGFTTETRSHGARKHREENGREDGKAGAGANGGPSDWNAKIFANGEECKGARCTVKPGAVLVKVEAEGMETKRESFEIEAWAVRVVNVTLVPLNQSGAASSSPPAAAVKTRVVRSKALLWTAIGLAAAGVGLGAMGVASDLAVSGLEDKIRAIGNSASPDVSAALALKRDSDSTRRTIFFAVSGATLAASAVVTVFFARGKREVLLLPTAGGFVVAGAF